MPFEGYSTSIRGSSHDASGKPCQDASLFFAGEDYAVAAVSDGHGSSRHYRSEIGSELAVVAAKHVVSSCMGEVRDDFISGLKDDPERVMKRLTDAVLARWTDTVLEYDEDHPPTEAELALEEPDRERDVLRAYGATLICGVMSDDVVFGFQIGDGEMVATNDEGEADMPMPSDPDCFLNRTSSICGSDASEKFRHIVISSSVKSSSTSNLRTIPADPRKVSSLTVCTDGLSTSFNSPDSLMRYCAAVPGVLLKGDIGMLEGNLKLRSCSNTCDDVSMATVYRPDLCPMPPSDTGEPSRKKRSPKKERQRLAKQKKAKKKKTKKAKKGKR